MPKFKSELPIKEMEQIKKIINNSDEMFGEMTKAGARLVQQNVRMNMPKVLNSNNNFRKSVKLTRVYKTPTDDGINTKVIITGYFYSKHNKKKVPAPLVANAFEYGTSERHKLSGFSTGEITKTPFFRKSFKKAQITKAMEEVQKKYIKE